MATILARDGRGGIGRTVVHDQHFVIWIFQFLEGFQRIADRSRAVVAANHHRHPRPGHIAREGDFPKGVAHRQQRGLRIPVSVSEAELPILDFRSAAKPFVGPGIDEDPGPPVGKHRPNLPVEHVRLGDLAVPVTVQSHLGHDQWAVPGDVVQAAEVGIQAFLRFQINVEAGEIEERKLQILGGWVIDVGDQAFGVLGFCRPVETFEKTFQFAPAMPANDGGRDLVANGVTEDRRMASAGAHFGTNHLFNRAGALAVIEKSNRALDRQPGHDPQSVTLRGIQQPARRRRVGANRVDAVGGHVGEVALDPFAGRKFLSLFIRAEGSVGDPPHIHFFLADKYKFSLHPRTVQPRAVARFDGTVDVVRLQGRERRLPGAVFHSPCGTGRLSVPFVERDCIAGEFGHSPRMLVLVH